MIRSARTQFGLAVISAICGCLLYAPTVRSQGGTGRQGSAGSKAPVTNSTNASKPVPNIAGTIWQIEGFEGGKSQGANFFEFLPNGKLRVAGEDQPAAVWTQTGARVVIRVNGDSGSGRLVGAISGNQMTGTMMGTDNKGASMTLKLKGKRADATALSQLNFWKSIRTSSNPEDFRTYLQRYPNGAFEADARARLGELEKKTTPDSANPTVKPSPQP